MRSARAAFDERGAIPVERDEGNPRSPARHSGHSEWRRDINDVLT